MNVTTWFLTLTEECTRRVSEYRVQNRIFEPKKEQFVGGWRSLHYEEIHWGPPSLLLCNP